MNVNDTYIAIGLGFIAVAAIGVIVYAVLEKWQTGVESRRLHRQFEQKMATTPMPSYDGNTYDWDPDTVRSLLGDPAETRAQPVYTPDEYAYPVPDSQVSGPMPVMDTPMAEETDDFIAQLKADNEAFLASLAPDGIFLDPVEL
jgi:hypothetical protein